MQKYFLSSNFTAMVIISISLLHENISNAKFILKMLMTTNWQMVTKNKASWWHGVFLKLTKEKQLGVLIFKHDQHFKNSEILFQRMFILSPSLLPSNLQQFAVLTILLIYNVCFVKLHQTTWSIRPVKTYCLSFFFFYLVYERGTKELCKS